jgi:adenine-specific DNA-methyltransferase
MSLSNNKSIIILADCLEALSRLEDSTVDLVYLDPPWNTGNEGFFLSNDASLNYDEFIYRVIQQAHRVLKKDGNLVLYSIPALNVNFHNLIRPVFGDKNFRAEFIIPIAKQNFRNKMFRHTHETVILYSKTDNFKFYPLVELSELKINQLFPLKDKNNRRFKLDSLIFNGERNGFNFEWNGFKPSEDKVWRFSKDRLNRLEEEGKIYFEKDMAYPKLKIYSDENNISLIGSVWSDINPYAKNSFGYNFQQSEELISRIINITTEKGDSVLDPFCGSGITGIVASKLIRSWQGIEVEYKAFELAVNYFEKEKTNLKIDKNIISKEVIWDDYTSLNASNIDIVIEKINKGENERVEFKESYNFNNFSNTPDTNLPNKIMEEIASFLNSKYGGSIFLGVKNDGEIFGLESNINALNGEKSKDKLELAITSKIKTSFGGISIDLINLEFYEIDNKTICEIKVTANDEPVFFDKNFHVRNGTQSTKISNQEFFELMLKRRKIKR